MIEWKQKFRNLISGGQDSNFFMVICSTVEIPRVTVDRDAQRIRLTAYRWRCDEFEMRGTCLEAQKSKQAKVVINS